ncbi:hypothetical protein CLV46_0916 [Diaminobutyricimonas aerilata]|uniref:Uncharacterized protein n=1 Tax=Diaminobutyricimonas aerilata TaxID=1162967 RepID=A0A2M9CHH7_9MICO|nr:hypothetical protein [Diaminobutyricimonas aerilata]PJJ71371.1 hypothetical protein CLV46_0916 [Diaminobutyricimonas aerilata]
MTASVVPTSFRSAARRAYSWHPPLMTLAAATVVLTVVALAGYLVDPRELVGVPLWEKPLKFAISTFLYAVTFAWLISLLTRGRRFAWLVGTVSAVGLVIELVVIVGLQVAGQTSHFNVSTPFAAAMWAVMATSIAVVWVAALVVAFALLRAPLGDPARSLAIRAGAFIGVIGMALAFLMTSPTAQQLADYQGIVGAHAVGVPDGGPGLPLLGWSTVAGDLRIPHFVGMHALQLLPLGLLALELLARRVTPLRSARVRRDLVAIATVAYLAVLGLLTWQALRGQSIVAPDTITAVVTAGLAAAVSAAVALVLAREVRRPAVDAEPAVPSPAPTPTAVG